MKTTSDLILTHHTKRPKHERYPVVAQDFYQNDPSVDQFVVMVTSATEQGTTYPVSVDNDGAYCTCIGYGYAGHCHHQQPALDKIATYKRQRRNRAHSLIPLGWLLGANEPLGVA